MSNIFDTRNAYRAMVLNEDANIDMEAILADVDKTIEGKGKAFLKKTQMVLRSKLFQTEDHFGSNSKEYLRDYIALRKITLMLSDDAEDVLHIMHKDDLKAQAEKMKEEDPSDASDTPDEDFVDEPVF